MLGHLWFKPNAGFCKLCEVINVYVLFAASFSFFDERIDFLIQKCIEELKSQGFEE